MAVVELRGLASLLQELKLRPDIQSTATTTANTVEDSLWKWGTVLTKNWGEVFAYEVDGMHPCLRFNIFGVLSGDPGYGGAAIQDGLFLRDFQRFPA